MVRRVAKVFVELMYVKQTLNTSAETHKHFRSLPCSFFQDALWCMWKSRGASNDLQESSLLQN